MEDSNVEKTLKLNSYSSRWNFEFDQLLRLEDGGNFPSCTQSETRTNTQWFEAGRAGVEVGEWSDRQCSNVIHKFNTSKLRPSFLLPVEENVMSLADNRQWPGAWHKANETETRSTHAGLIAPLAGYLGSIGLQLVFVNHKKILVTGRTDTARFKIINYSPK